MIVSFYDIDTMVVFLSSHIYALNCLPSLCSDEIFKKKESINTYRLVYKYNDIVSGICFKTIQGFVTLGGAWALGERRWTTCY